MVEMSIIFFFSSRRRHTRCALVTGVQTCALPICPSAEVFPARGGLRSGRFERLGQEMAALAIVDLHQIGGESCRERVGQYVYIVVVSVALKKKISRHTTQTSHKVNRCDQQYVR